MNTKNLPKEYLIRKKLIINLHKEGKSINEITKLTKTRYSIIKGILERNESIENSGIFNVNKYDCWIIPTSNEY